jgi:uncharacterized caspase-like protein
MNRTKILICVASLVMWSAAAAEKNSSGARAVGGTMAITSMTDEQRSAAGINLDDSAGLFVGINEFKDEKLEHLEFAVDDAVDLAFLFCKELKLITPKNAYLGLAGEPKKEETKRKLKKLLDEEATRFDPNYTALLNISKAVVQQTRKPGLLVIHISSHGFSENGNAYLLASDSVLSRLNKTALVIADFKNDLSNDVGAQRKLFFVDACRNKVMRGRGSRSVNDGLMLDDAFTKALKDSQGMAILCATSNNKYSYESKELENGYFTYYLMAGLRGDAPGDSKGLVRVGSLSKWVKDKVNDATSLKEPPQVPSDEMDDRASEIPLAYSAENDEALNARKNKALDKLEQAKKASRSNKWNVLNPELASEVETTLDRLRGEDLEYLLTSLEEINTASKVSVKKFTEYWKGSRERAADAVRALPREDDSESVAPRKSNEAKRANKKEEVEKPKAAALQFDNESAFKRAERISTQLTANYSNNIVHMKARRVPGQLHPDSWEITFGDSRYFWEKWRSTADTQARIDSGKFMAGFITAVEDATPMDRKKLVKDSTDILEMVAARFPTIRLASSEFEIDHEKWVPLWRVKIWAYKINQPAQEAELGRIDVDASTGAILRDDLNPDRLR